MESPCPTLRGRIRVLFVLLALAIAGAPEALAGPESPANGPSPEGAGPTAVIDRFHDELLAVMKEAKTLGVEGRYERLEPVIKKVFLFPLMIRIASGSHWKDGSEETQTSLVAAFEDMSVATYADRFDGWNGHRFETVAEKPGPQGTRLVETRLHRPDDDPVEIVYVMRDVGGEWKIVDVLLDGGISELARYRSEYRKVLKDDGLDGLIRNLREKRARILGPADEGTRS